MVVAASKRSIKVGYIFFGTPGTSARTQRHKGLITRFNMLYEHVVPYLMMKTGLDRSVFIWERNSIVHREMMRSEYIFHNSGHSEFIYVLCTFENDICRFLCTFRIASKILCAFENDTL